MFYNTFMKDKLPAGFTQEEWNAVTEDLREHPGTVNDYRKVLSRFHAYGYDIKTITPEEADRFFRMLEKEAQEGRLSQNTVHRYQVTLRAVANRMQKSSLFAGYENPFAGMIRKERRTKRKYTEQNFADPAVIAKLIRQIPSFPVSRQILYESMCLLGLFPHQLEKIKISDFRDASDSRKIRLFLQEEETPARSARKRIPETSFTFFEEYTARLRQNNPQLGHIDDTRNYFLTSRHLPYTYRSIYQAVRNLCLRAGLDENAVTPYQLSLYGIMRSYILDKEIRRHSALDLLLERAGSENEIRRIRRETAKCEAVLIPLARTGWIGTWDRRYPASRMKIIHAIIQQRSEEDLYRLMGIRTRTRSRKSVTDPEEGNIHI